jgi:mono/diheme cytochrome c family protein
MKYGMLIALMTLLFCACGADTSRWDKQSAAIPDTVTFAEHIAPIVHANCSPCHRPGQAGPFSLITYDDVRRKAKTIKKVTGAGYMPPWPADTSYSHFLGERVLTQRDIALIAKWVDKGAVEGDPASMVAFDMNVVDGGLGKPDAVVWIPDVFAIPGDARDRFVITKAPFALERDTFLRAIEFVPGNRRAVHHMNGALINYATGAKADPFGGAAYLDAEQVESVDAFAWLQLQNDDGTWPALVPSAINYLPGMAPVQYPEGIGGLHLSAQGAFLLNTLHYGPSSRDTSDRSHFNLYFAPRAPERPLRELFLGSTHTHIEPPLHLEPGDVRTFHTELELQEDISVLSINPHMHLLGTRFLAYAVTLAKDTVPLVRINDWDFRWQYTYTFPHMIPMNSGTVIHVEGTFDNSADNPQQAFDPPRAITGTDSKLMRTTDEMLQFFVSYVDYRKGDEAITLAPTAPAPPPRALSGGAATMR